MAIILHFGFPKTGTTYLQQVLRKSGAALDRAGLVYPLAGGDFKQRALKHLTTKNPRSVVPEELDALQAAIDAETARMPGAHVLLSVEEISGTVMSTINATTAAAVRDWLARWQTAVRLLVYVRRPEDFYLSMMQEKLKRGGTIVAPAEFRTDFARIIRCYEDAFDTRAIVRPFERDQWRNGDLLCDFLDQIRDLADVDETALATQTRRSNESLSAETMWALETLRRFPPAMSTPPTYSFAQSERLWRKLRDIAEEGGYTRKPQLFAGTAATVAAANQHDSDAIEARYGVRFRTVSAFSPAEPPAEDQRLNGVEGIVPVDRDAALRIISVFCARENAHRVKNG